MQDLQELRILLVGKEDLRSSQLIRTQSILLSQFNSHCSIQEGLLELGDWTLMENCFMVASRAC